MGRGDKKERWIEMYLEVLTLDRTTWKSTIHVPESLFTRTLITRLTLLFFVSIAPLPLSPRKK
jgi:hypothetical protein